MFYLDNAFILELMDRTGRTPEKAERFAVTAALAGNYEIEHCYLRVFANEMREALLDCPQEKTAQTVQGFMAENEEAVKMIVAGWVRSRGGDGRLYPRVKEWAEGVEGHEIFGCPLHSCYLNKVALDLFVAPGQNVPMF